MKAIIAGGGIGGLAAAIALRNEGWEVHVFERSKELVPGNGNGITIGANGLRLLESWNIDLDDLRAEPFIQERHFDEATGKLISRCDHDWTTEATGYPWLGVRRMRLAQVLQEAARNTPQGKIPVRVHCSAAVERIDCEEGRVWTQDGQLHEGDVVIVADGVFSKLVYAIDQDAQPLRPILTCFRMELNSAGLLADEVLRSIYENEPEGFVTFKTSVPGFVMFSIPEADGKRYSLLLHPDVAAKDGSEHRWDVEASLAELQEVTKESNGLIKRMLPFVRNPIRWTLNVRDPVARFNRGKTVAIGDAAHPHIPYHGQGACSAMEDAASLAIFLTSLGDESIQQRLEKWNRFRYGRACTIQQISASGGKPLHTYIDVIRDKIKYAGPLPESVKLHDRPVQEFFFKYDVRIEARAAIARDVSRAEAEVGEEKVPRQNGSIEVVH